MQYVSDTLMWNPCKYVDSEKLQGGISISLKVISLSPREINIYIFGFQSLILQTALSDLSLATPHINYQNYSRLISMVTFYDTHGKIKIR